MKRLVFGLGLAWVCAAQGEGIEWIVNEVRWGGPGCEFVGTPERAQDAWVIAAGDEISIIYTNLGSTLQTLGQGSEMSSCVLSIPINIPMNTYVSEVSQKFIYGMAKQRGVEASIWARTNIMRMGGRRGFEGNPEDARQLVSEAMLRFANDQELNVSQQEVTLAPVRISEQRNGMGPFQRFCRVARDRRMLFQSQMQVNVRRLDPSAQISIAIDGEDLRFSSKNMLAQCPDVRNPPPPPPPPGNYPGRRGPVVIPPPPPPPGWNPNRGGR